MPAAQQPRRTRLHAQDGFYRQLLGLCLFLSVAMCLPPPATRFSHVGFLLLTLLLAHGLAASINPARGPWPRLLNQLYGYLAVFTILIQIVWLLQPTLLNFKIGRAHV